MCLILFFPPFNTWMHLVIPVLILGTRLCLKIFLSHLIMQHIQECSLISILCLKIFYNVGPGPLTFSKYGLWPVHLQEPNEKLSQLGPIFKWGSPTHWSMRDLGERANKLEPQVCIRVSPSIIGFNDWSPFSKTLQVYFTQWKRQNYTNSISIFKMSIQGLHKEWHVVTCRSRPI